MDKKKILLAIETNPKDDIFYNDWLKAGYSATVLFKKVCKPLRMIRKYWLTNNLPFSYIWYEKWYKNLDQYDSIVIHMSYLTRFMPFIINKRYPSIKVKCWYWNTVVDNNKPIKTDINNIQYYSFDKNDCEKYQMKYNIQYYCEQEDISKTNIKSDILFIGLNKGREETIKDLENVFVNKDLKCDIKIINSLRDFIPYYEIKNQIRKTRSLLDINKKNQDGFSLRILESLFFETKLITNNIKVKNEPFYNKKNIFIIGEDDLNNINEFIYSNYDSSVNKYKKDYNLDTWINNFFK